MMALTLWFGVRGDQLVQYDRRDRTFMEREWCQLDELCQSIGVAELSSFFDSSDLKPETDHVPTSWFDAAPAIETISALCELLLGNAETLPFTERVKTELLEELTTLLAPLEDAAAAQQPFHLALIM
jgi:hypothetical protein